MATGKGVNRKTGNIKLTVDTSELSRMQHKLSKVLPQIVQDGLKDFAKTVMQYAIERTPLGWRYVKGAGNKTKKSGRAFGVALGNYRRSNVAAPGRFMRHPDMWKLTDKRAKSITIRSKAKYGAILEEGKYPTPKGSPPRAKPWEWGWRVEGGYSKQAPGGILGPLLADKKGGGAINHTLKDAIDEYQRAILITAERVLKRMQV